MYILYIRHGIYWLSLNGGVEGYERALCVNNCTLVSLIEVYLLMALFQNLTLQSLLEGERPR